MSTVKRSIDLDVDASLLPAAEAELATGDFATFDQLVSAALGEFLAHRTDLSDRYAELRTTIQDRAAQPLKDALTPDQAAQRLDQLLTARGLL